MITDLFDKNICKVLTLFSISPGSKFTRNEIKEKVLLHNVNLDNALNTLISNKILIKNKRLLSLNIENNNLSRIMELIKKEYVRLKELPLNIYYLLTDITSILSEKNEIEAIYLFGSYAKLIYTEKSDVDLAIILKKENHDIVKKIKKIVLKWEKRYNKIIELHFFEKKDLLQKDPIIKEILRNGVEL